MRDPLDMPVRARDIKQALLLALRGLNEAVLDGSRDEADALALTTALGQAQDAASQMAVLRKRLEFFRELERYAQHPGSGEGSRRVIALVKLGVDAGFTIEEVKARISGQRS